MPERKRKQQAERDKITAHGTDDWECLCGNTPDEDGFLPVDETVNEVEPTAKEWETNCLCCVDCGRVIDNDSHEVMRQIDPEHFVRIEDRKTEATLEDVAGGMVVLDVKTPPDEFGNCRMIAWWHDVAEQWEGGPPNHVRGQVFHTKVERFVSDSRLTGRDVKGINRYADSLIPEPSGRIHPSLLEPGDVVGAPWRSLGQRVKVESVEETTVGEHLGDKLPKDADPAERAWLVTGKAWIYETALDEVDRVMFASERSSGYPIVFDRQGVELNEPPLELD